MKRAQGLSYRAREAHVADGVEWRSISSLSLPFDICPEGSLIVVVVDTPAILPQVLKDFRLYFVER